MKKVKPRKQVAIDDIEPGERFMYEGTEYTRATPEEFAKHPAVERLPIGDHVLAYMHYTKKNPADGKRVEYRRPVSFCKSARGQGDTPLLVWIGGREE